MTSAIVIDNVDALLRVVSLGTTEESLVLEFKRELDGFGANAPEVLRAARLDVRGMLPSS